MKKLDLGIGPAPKGQPIHSFRRQTKAIGSGPTVNGVLQVFAPNTACTVQWILVQTSVATILQPLLNNEPFGAAISVNAGSMARFAGTFLVNNETLSVQSSVQTTLSYEVVWTKDFDPTLLQPPVFFSKLTIGGSGGLNGSVQFNQNGSLAGDSNFTYDAVDQHVSISSTNAAPAALVVQAPSAGPYLLLLNNTTFGTGITKGFTIFQQNSGDVTLGIGASQIFTMHVSTATVSFQALTIDFNQPATGFLMRITVANSAFSRYQFGPVVAGVFQEKASIDQNGAIKQGQFTVATLPAGVEGNILYATNGRKVGEGVGAGTGVPVYFSNGSWRVFSTDAAVAA